MRTVLRVFALADLLLDSVVWEPGADLGGQRRGHTFGSWAWRCFQAGVGAGAQDDLVLLKSEGGEGCFEVLRFSKAKECKSIKDRGVKE